MEFYRYKILDLTQGSGFFYIPECEVTLLTFPLVRETPKGYWILDELDLEKWISKTSRKRFAYPTKKEAFLNFKKRTEKRLKILSHQVNLCKIALKETNNGKEL